jgi:hypothetical protein
MAWSLAMVIHCSLSFDMRYSNDSSSWACPGLVLLLLPPVLVSSFCKQQHTIQVVIFWVMIPCSDVVGHQCFRHPCCLHMQVMLLCSDVVEYQHFREICCLHLHVVTLCHDVVGYQYFSKHCCLQLQGEVPGARKCTSM